MTPAGGGEFLLSLSHPLTNCSATENFGPNVELCKDKLLPLGIDFKKADGLNELPFNDESFDIIINRHGDYNTKEIYRLLKKGGMFITEQVGAENDRELVKLLIGDIDLPYQEQYLDKIAEKFKSEGFEVVRAEEEFRPIKFYDIGALVWFARIKNSKRLFHFIRCNACNYNFYIVVFQEKKMVLTISI